MRIERLLYHDRAADWHLDATDFFPDVTLFIGNASADKRQILSAIETLAQFALGHSPDELWGVDWNITFSTEGRTYGWQGATSGRGVSFRDGMHLSSVVNALLPEALRRGVEPMVLHESLFLDGHWVVERKGDTLRCNGTTTFDHSPIRSLLQLLRHDAVVEPASDGFARVVRHDAPGDSLRTMGKPLGDLCATFPTLAAIRASNLPIYAKLALVHENAPGVFRDIVAHICKALPSVEDVGFDRVDRSRFTDVPSMRVLERGTERWLPESKISTEMLRALLHVSSPTLWPDDGVVLIDDFETSLGISCLDQMLESIRDESRRLQYILTSRDPAVIERVGAERCKVVNWEGNVVSAESPLEPEGKPRATGIATAPGGKGDRSRRITTKNVEREKRPLE